jgi:hypothetical protein
MTALRDLTGQRFGRLLVTERASSNRHGQTVWMCLCDCGSVRPVVAARLTGGAVRSCKCSWHRRQSQHHRWRECGELPGRYWSTLLRNAETRGYVVGLTIEQAWDLFVAQHKRCALTGLPLVIWVSFSQEDAGTNGLA